MKKTAAKTSLLSIIFISLLLASVSSQAEHAGKIIAGSLYNPAFNATLSANTVLEHNKRLLLGTTIAETLASGNESKARDLFIEAYDLNLQAEEAFKSGNMDAAKELASQSIHILYRADRLHYNLPDASPDQ